VHGGDAGGDRLRGRRADAPLAGLGRRLGRRGLVSAMALSTSTPVGSPLASRMILPPAGSGVALPTPASFSTAELTHTAWPSTRRSATGRSPSAASRLARVGNAPPHGFWSQPRPSIHSPAGRPCAAATTRATASASDAARAG
jgi:hypothetical protein